MKNTPMVQFKAKVQTCYCDEGIAYQYVVIPKLNRKHCIDMQTFRDSQRWGFIANSDFFLSGLNKAVKAIAVNVWSSRTEQFVFKLGDLPDGVEVDSTGYLAVVTVCLA